MVKTFPNAGEISKIIFAVGIIGTGLLSIPVLSGSTAYALSDTFNWKQGLSKKFGQAKAFYLIIVISGIIGLSMNFLGINPIKALVYASVINGVVSVPILFVIMKIANDKEILKENTNGRLLKYYWMDDLYYNGYFNSHYVYYIWKINGTFHPIFHFEDYYIVIF